MLRAMSEPLFHPSFLSLALLLAPSMGLSNQIQLSLPLQPQQVHGNSQPGPAAHPQGHSQPHGQTHPQGPQGQQFAQQLTQAYPQTNQHQLPLFLVLTNCPPDLTPREATIIFSLVIDDILSIEISDYKVIAAFKLPLTCITTAKLLDGKCIFGQEYAPVKIELDQSQGLSNQFLNMRLLSQLPLLLLPPLMTPSLGTGLAKLSQSRLRFVFSDPFAPANGAQPVQPNGQAPPHIDLTELLQNLLMLALANPTTPADPWGPQLLLLLNSAPRTPSVNAPFDWLSQNGQTNGQVPPPDRRRTSLAFFTNTQQFAQAPVALQASLSSLHTSHPSSQPALAPLVPLTLLDQQTSLPHTLPVGPTPQLLKPPSSAPSNQSSLQLQPQSLLKDVPDLSLLARVPPPANPADQNPPCNTLYVGNLPPDATEAELRTLFMPQKGYRRLSFRTKNSLLNNGLGGLSHNHGPMCFVEFEDVAHATRALAELYGRALPRPNGGNGKGGIRLSFSKNPLGVRGPGNPRRSLTQQLLGQQQSLQQQQQSQQPQQPQPLQQQQAQAAAPPAGGVGNYGYSNYHVK